MAVEFEDAANFAASELGPLGDVAIAALVGVGAVDYAFENFAVDHVADRFEAVLLHALQQKMKRVTGRMRHLLFCAVSENTVWL